MNPWVVAILGLTVLSMVVMVRGQQRNRRFAAALSRLLERSFLPTKAHYRNIGGVVGYHFSFELSSPYRACEGTMTFFPRHALFYYPIARLFQREDELRLTITAEFSTVGVGYVVSRQKESGGWIDVADTEQMNSDRVEISGRELTTFYHYRGLADRMVAFLGTLDHIDSLRQFGCHGPSRTFFFHVEPRLEELEAFLSGVITGLPAIVDNPG